MTGYLRDRSKLVTLALLAAALIFGTWARLYGLSTKPMWLDESYSAFAADHDFRFLWHVVPSYESHPPAYYSFLKIWRMLFGKSLIAMRLLGASCGLSTVIMVGLCARQIGRLLKLDAQEALVFFAISVAFASLQPLMISMSHEIRPYPVMITVYTVGIFALLNYAEVGVRNTPALLAVFVCQSLMSWSHSVGPIYTFSLGLAILAVVIGGGRTRADWLWLIGGELIVAAIYIPGAFIVHKESSAWAGSTWVKFSFSDMRLVFRETFFNLHSFSAWTGVAIILLACILLFRRNGGPRIALALLFLGFVPFFAAAAFSYLYIPVLLPRVVSPATVPVLLLVAFGLTWRGQIRLIALVPFAIIAAPMALVDWQAMSRNYLEPWNLVAQFASQHMGPKDVIWAYPNEVAIPLTYALTDARLKLPVLQVPGPVPYLASVGTHPAGSPGSPSLDEQHISALMRTKFATQPDTIWLIRREKGLYDPHDELVHALMQKRRVVDVETYREIDLIGFRREP